MRQRCPQDISATVLPSRGGPVCCPQEEDLLAGGALLTWHEGEEADNREANFLQVAVWGAAEVRLPSNCVIISSAGLLWYGCTQNFKLRSAALWLLSAVVGTSTNIAATPEATQGARLHGVATEPYTHRLLFAEEHLCEVHPGQHQRSKAKHHQEYCQANCPVRHLFWGEVKSCIMLKGLCTAAGVGPVR
jgi:hypothetical protein